MQIRKIALLAFFFVFMWCLSICRDIFGTFHPDNAIVFQHVEHMVLKKWSIASRQKFLYQMSLSCLHASCNFHWHEHHTLSNKPCVAWGAQTVELSPDFRSVVWLCVLSIFLEHPCVNKWYSWSFSEAHAVTHLWPMSVILCGIVRSQCSMLNTSVVWDASLLCPCVCMCDVMSTSVHVRQAKVLDWQKCTFARHQYVFCGILLLLT